MASEQTPIETPVESQEVEQTPEVAQPTEAAPPTEAETTTEEEVPAKPSAKEKVTAALHQTGDKIKASVAGVKEKVSKK